MCIRDRGAHREGARTDVSADRRRDPRVVEVDPRRFHGGLLLLNHGGRLAERRLSIIGVLAADRIDLDQIGIALGLQPGGHQGGAGVGQLRCRLIERGLIGRRIDAIEALARLHIGALLEQPRLNDPVDLRSHIGNLERTGSAGQIRLQSHGLRPEHDHAHRRRSHRRGSGGFRRAGGQQGGRDQQDARRGSRRSIERHHKGRPFTPRQGGSDAGIGKRG